MPALTQASNASDGSKSVELLSIFSILF